jgi:hypothetical protein
MNKPWLKPQEGLISAYYTLHFKKVNGNTIYLPGVDRFLLADNFDPWITLETAEILSSKVPTQVVVLGEGIPGLSNLTALEHTIQDKTTMVIHGANILVARQTPSIRKLNGAGGVIEVGWPDDYTTSESKAMLLKLQEYGMFCLRVCHALKITESLHNVVPHKKYMDEYFSDMIPEEFAVPVDQTAFPKGLSRTIKHVLYMANDVEDALEKIENVWFEYSASTPLIRETFYKFVGLPIPSKLLGLALSHNYTIRAV